MERIEVVDVFQLEAKTEITYIGFPFDNLTDVVVGELYQRSAYIENVDGMYIYMPQSLFI